MSVGAFRLPGKAYGSGAGLTIALLNAAFGTPSQVGAGFNSVYHDTVGAKFYTVVTDGTNWYTILGTVVSA